MSDSSTAALVAAGFDIFATKCWYIGASALVFFDYLLLFDNEVKYVWRRKLTLVSYLYLFVRYYSMIATILDAILIFDPFIDTATCKRAAFIEPILATIPLLAAANTLLILRIRALYRQARFIPILLGCLLLSQIAVGMWVYLQPGKIVISSPPDLPPIFDECINVPNPALRSRSALYLFLETGFDSAIFLLTSYRTWSEVLAGRSRVRNILARDGFFYYGVIFAITLSWALMVIFAPPDLQYINAIPTNCMTAIMVCRITLNLREAGNTQQRWVHEPQNSLSALASWPLEGRSNLGNASSDPAASNDAKHLFVQPQMSASEALKLVKAHSAKQSKDLIAEVTLNAEEGGGLTYPPPTFRHESKEPAQPLTALHVPNDSFLSF